MFFTRSRTFPLTADAFGLMSRLRPGKADPGALEETLASSSFWWLLAAERRSENEEGLPSAGGEASCFPLRRA
jgi:hypothetical protein